MNMITELEADQSYLTNWNVQLLCQCKKQEKCLRVHDAIACEVSISGACLASDHNICQHKKLAMQLTIPAFLNGAQKKVVKVIGRCLSTVMRDGRFLTAMEFIEFDGDGKKQLEIDLRKRFRNSFFDHSTS